MNKLLIAAFHLSRRPRKNVSVVIVTDTPDLYARGECARMLAPWAGWLHLQDHVVVNNPAEADLFVRSREDLVSLCMVGIAEDLQIQQALRAACAKRQADLVEATFPPVDTLENSLIREVSHFDFELGGKNEWDGSPTRWARETLRLLSAAHCRDSFPKWGFPAIDFRVPPSRAVDVLDIGCGPISVLRWGALNSYLTITGLDPLLDMYALIRARHGLDRLPAIACSAEICEFAENLDTESLREKFDAVYTQNALDHTQQPAMVVENIGRVLKPGGCAIVQVATREGSRQKWDQLHKTDIFIDGEELRYAHEHTRAMPLLSPQSRLKLAQVYLNKPDWLACRLERV